MDNFLLRQFGALIRRELLEHKHLFLGAPLVLAVLILVAAVWMLNFGSQELIVDALTRLGTLTEGLRGSALAPLLMPAAIPFVGTLYVCMIVYLVNSLYQDRRDMSILFWQSMPVSNFKTVMSKLVTVCLIAPLFMVGVVLVLMLAGAVGITFVANINNVETIGFWQLLSATLNSMLLVYLTAVLGSLWLFPTLGWLMLFSAFARSQPFLWAIGSFILITFLEGFIFNTQYLADWIESRSGFYRYLVLQPSDFIDRLFSYDMLFGIALGALVITGATYMRRFID